MTQKMVHPSGIDQEIVDKVVGRRGGLNAFPTLNPRRTALVVVDLDMGTARDTEEQVNNISGRVNALAASLRQHGGTVAWVTTPIQEPTENFRAVFGKAADRFIANGKSGISKRLWPELDSKENDIHATKQGHSAFFPGKCDLHKQLVTKEIESILIVGAVTNVCCEGTARDATELQYKVTMISDACIGNPNLHQATLTTFFRWFGDVRPTEDILKLIIATGN